MPGNNLTPQVTTKDILQAKLTQSATNNNSIQNTTVQFDKRDPPNTKEVLQTESMAEDSSSKVQQILENLKEIEHNQELVLKNADELGTNQSTACSYCGQVFSYPYEVSEHLAQSQCARINANQCKFCNLTFDNLEKLKSHVETHAAGQLHLCTICGTWLSDKHSLADHVNIHTGEYPHACPVCHKGFRSKHCMMAHERTHSGPGKKAKNRICEICGKNFNNASTFKRHLMIHTGEKPYKCEWCGKSFIKSDNHKRHLRTHTGEKPYKCVLCASAYSTRCDLKKHLIMHTRDARYTCTICDLKFTQAAALSRHTASQHKQHSHFPCDMGCGKSFTTFQTMRAHSRNHKNGSRHVCTFIDCGQIFINRNKLDKHLESEHSGVRSVKCNICAQIFTDPTELADHMILHTPVIKSPTSYSCKVCSKIFPHHRSLQGHMKFHTGDTSMRKPVHRKNKCDICSEKFVYAVSRYEHMKEVHGVKIPDKKPECLICKLILPNKGYLANHMKSHANDINYKCTVCSEEFKYRHDYKRHRSSKHPGYNFESKDLLPLGMTEDQLHACSLCGKQYIQKAGLAAHMKKHKLEEICTCSICKLSFKNVADYREHCTILHPGEELEENSAASHLTKELIQTCAVCHREFHQKAAFSNHMKSHLLELNCMCTICDESFKHVEKYQEHCRNEHPGADVDASLLRNKLTENLIQKCPICGREFIQKAGFVNHMKTHILETNCTCSLCKTSFKHLADYRKHCKAEHPGVDVEANLVRNELAQGFIHICTICNREFLQKPALISHMRTHGLQTKVTRPDNTHKCSFCERLFKNKNGLAKHLRMHKTHKCYDCKQIFTQRASLVKHKKKCKKRHRCYDCNDGFKCKIDLQKHQKKCCKTKKLGKKSDIKGDELENENIKDASNNYNCESRHSDGTNANVDKQKPADIGSEQNELVGDSTHSDGTETSVHKQTHAEVSTKQDELVGEVDTISERSRNETFTVAADTDDSDTDDYSVSGYNDDINNGPEMIHADKSKSQTFHGTDYNAAAAAADAAAADDDDDNAADDNDTDDYNMDRYHYDNKDGNEMTHDDGQIYDKSTNQTFHGGGDADDDDTDDYNVDGYSADNDGTAEVSDGTLINKDLVNNSNMALAGEPSADSGHTSSDGTSKITQSDNETNKDIKQRKSVHKRKCKRRITKKSIRGNDKKVADGKGELVPKKKQKPKMNLPATKVDTVEDKRERCSLCGSRFDNIAELSSHQAECADTRVMVCKLCGRGWCSETELLNHIPDHLANETKQTLDYLCTLGAIKVSSSLGPDTMLEHHNNYICMLCGKWFNRKSNCETHLYTHGEKKISCDKCDKKFALENQLKEHMKVHSETYKLQCTCPVCNKVFNRKSNLNLHTRLAHTDDYVLYECKICNTSFKYKNLYNDHVKRHFSDEEKANAYLNVPKKEYMLQHICLVCGRSFHQKKNLKRHEEIHLGINERKYLCTECGKAFTSHSSLGVHLRVHKGERPYTCDQCGMNFVDGSTRNRHIKRIHNKELMEYICEECGKSCMTPSELTIHMRTHTGEKPFKCDQCGKDFPTNGRLTQHKKSHTMTFQCTYCFKHLATNKSLKTHVRIHTGESPYSCPECGKCFKQSQQVKNHMVVHTGDMPYHCEVCDKRFSYSSSLFTHMKLHN